MANETVFNKGYISLGGITKPYKAVISTYTVLDSDYYIDATSGTFTITLLTAVNRGGQSFVIKNSGSDTITVATTSSQTIDGSTTVTLTQYQTIELSSNGSNWVVNSRNSSSFVVDATTSIKGIVKLAGDLGGTADLPIVTSTMQKIYNNDSAGTDILTDSTRGAFTLQRGSALDADNVLEIKDGAGNSTSIIRGNGDMVFTRAGSVKKFEILSALSPYLRATNQNGNIDWQLSPGGASQGHFIMGTPSAYIEGRQTNNYLRTSAGTPVGIGSIPVATAKFVVDSGRSLFNINEDNGVDQVQVNGSLIATTLKKSGGTSSQFLKANGSVDSTVYATDSNVMHLSGNETFTGTKSSTITSTDAFSITNNGTLSGSALNVTISSTGNGVRIINTSASSGVGINIENNTGSFTYPLNFTINNMQKAYLDYDGIFFGQQFQKAGGNSNQALMATGGVLIVESSDYIPTFSNLNNISSVTNTRSTYNRIGNIVSVMISGNFTSSATGTNSFEATLPFTAGSNVHYVGSGVSNIGTSDSESPLSVIKTTTTTVTIRGVRNGLSTNRSFSANFQYDITF